MGTLSQILKAIRLQQAGIPVQIVLGDLDAYNGKNLQFERTQELVERYHAFILNLGFNATPPNSLRAQCVEKEIAGGFDWVQDALELDDHSYLVGDSNNDRILRLDRYGKIIANLSWSKGSRKFAGFELVTTKQAREVFLLERSAER